MAKILLIEDDEELVEILLPALNAVNYTVDHAGTAEEGRAFLDSYSYEVIVLDWELPDGAGVELCRQFRANGGVTPVLMLTGRKSTEDKTVGLDSGSDDYLTKPYDFDELTARIRALMRRSISTATSSSRVTFGDLVLYPERREIGLQTKSMIISPIEFELLSFLVNHADSEFSFEALRVRVWQGSDISKNAISAVVTRLRKKLAESGSVVGITTVGREGYKLEIS